MSVYVWMFRRWVSGEGAQQEEQEEKRGARLDEILCVMSLRVDLDLSQVEVK